MIFSSKQKIPFIVYDGEEVADSHFCIKHLNRARGVDLNSCLGDEGRATARAFQMMTENHLFWWVTGYCNASNLYLLLLMINRADSRFASSQWETSLPCNDVSHWLGINLESALIHAAVNLDQKSPWRWLSCLAWIASRWHNYYNVCLCWCFSNVKRSRKK